MAARGLIVAAPRSGTGKTTVTLALAAALRRRGITVRTAKSGPDYIDPGFHAVATGAACINLDSWAMPPELLDRQVARAAPDGGLLLIESAMGLFDGVEAPVGRSGAAADLAARYRIPVVLVLDVSGQSQSAAAVARGFADHDPNVTVAGVVLNRVASERHRDAIASAMAAAGICLFGAMPRDASIALPERHLGLVQAEELGTLPSRIEALADMAERHLDLTGVAEIAAPLWTSVPLAGEGRGEGGAALPREACLPPPGQRIALAADAAFSFVYAHLLEGWRRAGAEIVRFSPLADEAPPENCDACWLPGGYPELHAGRIAGAVRFRAGLARFAETRPVHGECGGYMVLGAGLEDADGERHAMCGLLGHATSFARRRLHLGYREARLVANMPLGLAGTVIRGHEFHYASLTEPGEDAALAEFADASGRALGLGGGRRGRVSGAFFHAIARA
jgi:cobyrinic acid a,c-diamide synthase